MSGPSAITRPVRSIRPSRPVGPVGTALVLIAILVACSSAATNAPAPTQAAASPVAILSAAPATASPSPEAASPSTPAASSPSVAASPTATAYTGRYGGGATPTPAPKATPSATPKTSPKPTPKPVSIVVKTRATGIGTVLVGPNGRTLYTRMGDPTNGSGCNGSCATNWPPLLVQQGAVVKGGSGVSGKFTTFARSGKRQVAYNGDALYYYAGDTGAGQTNGDGLGYIWYAAQP